MNWILLLLYMHTYMLCGVHGVESGKFGVEDCVFSLMRVVKISTLHVVSVKHTCNAYRTNKVVRSITVTINHYLRLDDFYYTTTDIEEKKSSLLLVGVMVLMDFSTQQQKQFFTESFFVQS